MNDEEKKAIGQCRLLLNGDITLHIIDDDGGTAYYGIVNKEYNKDLETVLNLIEKQSKEIEKLQIINQMQKYRIEVMDPRELISRDEVEEIIKTRIKEIQNMYDKLPKNPKEHLHSKTEYLIVICELQSILNEIKGDGK